MGKSSLWTLYLQMNILSHCNHLIWLLSQQVSLLSQEVQNGRGKAPIS